MPNLDPSDVLRATMHRFKDELEAVANLPSLWRCYDCHRQIPRDELPMRCPDCSSEPLRGKKVGYKFTKIPQDAMICIKCCDRHSHLRQRVFEMQLQVYEQHRERANAN